MLQILDGVQHVPRERVQNLVGKQIVDVPVSKILVESVEPVAHRRQATARVDVHFPAPQILEQSVEVVSALSEIEKVIEVILQEQCVSMNASFHFQRRVVVQQLLTGVFGGLWFLLQKHRRQHGWTCPQPSPSLCSRSWWLE